MVIEANVGGQQWGNTLVVGAEYYDTILTPVPQGAVVFEKRNGEWEPVAKLLPDEPVANGSQFYGQAVALEDDLVVVSFAEDGTIGQRSVYVYVRPPGGQGGRHHRSVRPPILGHA